MRKKLHILTIIFLILASKLIGQNLDGIWLSSHFLETTKRNIPYKSDSIFTKAYLLLDFIDKENVIIKGLGKDKEFGKFSITNNNIRIKVGNDSIEGIFTEKDLIFTLMDTLNSIKQIYLRRIKNSKLRKNEIPDRSRFFNSSWKIESASKSKNYGINFNFAHKDSLDYLEKNIVLITKNKGLYGYTEIGNYTLDFYKNHLFLGVSNRDKLKENVYHIYKLENEIFYAETYEDSYSFTKPLIINNIKIKKLEYLTINQQKDIKSKLNGKWKAINNPIPFDTIGSQYEKFENQSFELTFQKKGKFKLMKKGIFINENLKEVSKTVITKGKWEISKTGNYIKIKTNNGWEKYITIEKLSNNRLNIFYDVKALEEKSHFYYRTLIELIK
ncbi:hypothetical protein [Polaribacter sp.]|uniref:hypothetical protein n=1 Tax=Polaribacter sp. TaxID=1920175 RepID=UPI003EF5D25D